MSQLIYGKACINSVVCQGIQKRWPEFTVYSPITTMLCMGVGLSEKVRLIGSLAQSKANCLFFLYKKYSCNCARLDKITDTFCSFNKNVQMLHINLNKIAGNHVEQSSFTDNLNQYQLRSLTDEKTPQLIFKIKDKQTKPLHWLAGSRQVKSSDRCVKISHHRNKQHLITLLTTVAQLH